MRMPLCLKWINAGSMGKQCGISSGIGFELRVGRKWEEPRKLVVSCRCRDRRTVILNV